MGKHFHVHGYYKDMYVHIREKSHFNVKSVARAFADRSNLRAHMQTHSDVKKYRCTQCSKTFSRMSLLNKHMENCLQQDHGTDDCSSTATFAM